MQRVAVDLHRALGRRDDVQLSSILLETSWRMTGVRTAPFLLSLLKRIPQTVRRDRVQVVLFSSMVTASVVPLLIDRIHSAGAIAAAIPVGRDLTLQSRLYQRWVPRVLDDLDILFPISRATGVAAEERGATEDRIEVVPCGVQIPRVPIVPSRGRSREALLAALRARGVTVRPDALLLLSVGRHQERKGFHWFVDQVMPRLAANVLFLLGGTGPMTPKIQEVAKQRGVGERIVLLGQVPEQLLAELYAGVDLFVMPNIPIEGDMEGFGVVMLEAGITGLPVLAADLEGIRDVITPGANGWLVPHGDAVAFAREIQWFAATAQKSTLSAKAADHIAANFGWDAIAERYLTLLAGRLPASTSKETKSAT